LRTVITDANGAVTHYGYDGARRLISLDYPAGTGDVAFSYDAAGNRTVMTDTIGTSTWAYDLLGRPLTMTAPLTGTLSYSYDRLGDRTRLVYPDGKVVTGTYTALNQMGALRTGWRSRAASLAAPTASP
jgi:YD repeat-containing protein